MKTPLQELIEWINTSGKVDVFECNKIVIEATELLEKEREIAQDYARFAIKCDRKGMPILEFQDWIKL
jgi:hypothetical protein